MVNFSIEDTTSIGLGLVSRNIYIKNLFPIFVYPEIAEHKQTDVEEKMPWPWNAFLKPPSSPVLLTMPLFFSTGTHGYLYDTWNSKGLILDYSYTSDCLSAKHTNSLLYTVTSNGLEIFTSRLYPFVSGCTKEMFKECKFAKKSEVVKSEYSSQTTTKWIHKLSRSGYLFITRLRL